MFPYEQEERYPLIVARYEKRFQYSKRKMAAYVLHYLMYILFLKKYSRNKIDYVFVGEKYKDLIRCLEPSKTMVLKDRRLFRKNENKENSNTSSCFPDNTMQHDMEKIFTVDPAIEKRVSKRIINKTVRFFEKIQPKCLVVTNDSLFLERYLVHCAKQAGVKTICIQDGLFSWSGESEIYHGKIADFIYVWSMQQQKVLEQKGLPSKKIKILGYPYDHSYIEHAQKKERYDNTKICLLGQPFEKFDIRLGQKKKRLFESIASELENYDVVYKPHPGEKNKDFLPEGVTIYRGTLSEALEKYDYFLAFTTTALLEATLAKKIAIQLLHPDFGDDVYEEAGFSYTYNIFGAQGIEKYIQSITKPFPMNDDAMYVPKDIARRFVELENE